MATTVGKPLAGSEQPVEGKCGAKLRRRERYCIRVPRKGQKRCRQHGGAKGSGRPCLHGMYSKRFRGVTPAFQKVIDQALNDPQLMDAKRPVALQQALLQHSVLVPDEGLIDMLARREMRSSRRSRKRRGEGEGEDYDEDDDDLEPTDADLAIARQKWTERSMRLVDRLGKRQIDALRQIKLGELIAAEAFPMMTELGIELARLIEIYVPEPKREEFMIAYRNRVREVIVRMSKIGE